VQDVQGGSFADSLEHRRADIALGPHPGLDRSTTIASVPFLRSRLMVVAVPGHHLAGVRDIAPSALAAERWVIGPQDIDPTTSVGLLFAPMKERSSRRKVKLRSRLCPGSR